jgi:outer membrane protein OmpA-like peptidoglycan-associated protein
MSFPLKLFIIVAVWLLYFLATFYGCQKELCQACGDEAGLIEEPAPTDAGLAALAASSPVYFQWSDAKAYTDPALNLDSLKRLVLAGQGEENILRITGRYFEGETASAGIDNLGLARAQELRGIFGAGLPDNRIELRAQAMDDVEGAQEGRFNAFAYEWIEPEKTVSETVEELDDRIIMRFPLGSVEREYDPKVDEYLQKLADRVKETGETITLIGHTDNVGTAENNQQLGLDRANAIKRLLESKGVSAAQISVDSKGMTQPVATNDTETGRRENRRVELRLIKKAQ